MGRAHRRRAGLQPPDQHPASRPASLCADDGRSLGGRAACRSPYTPLALGTLLLTLGLVLPPGGAGYDASVRFWHYHGGPCWCALAMYGTLLWTGLRYR